MKNLLFLITAVSFIAVPMTAQDAFKDLKNGEKAVKRYLDNNENTADLTKGLQMIEAALSDEAVAASGRSWLTKGKVLNLLATNEMKNKTLDVAGTYEIIEPNAAIMAYEALSKANELSAKKNEKKEVQIQMTQLENHLNNFAIVAYQAQDYVNAFSNFSTSIKAYDFMKSIGKTSRLEEGNLLSEQQFFAAVSGFYSKNYEGATPYLNALADADYSEPFVYEALYKVFAETDKDKALGYLAKGREMAPDDTGLLFAEINHYLQAGELNKLIGKLEMAIEKEPDNVSIYNTMGSVYDQLQQNEEDDAKSAEYREKAKSYYEIALEKDPTNFDAQYSIGALYYNKAASYVDKLNDLAADLSPAGMKKYDTTKAEMDELFKLALPYFEKSEELNGSDLNTIIALKEIYARLNNLEKSNMYKSKFEALQSGK